MSSLSSSSKISSTSSIRRRSPAASSSKNAVEEVDARNRIFLETASHDSSREGFENQEESLHQKKSKAISDKALNHNYVPSALEALDASGIYDEDKEISNSNNKINIYGNNQKIINQDLQNNNDDIVDEDYFDELA